MDYLLPTALRTSGKAVLTEDAPTPTNPLGAKGMGESGVVGMGAAIGNAVADAVESAAAVSRLPLTPERVRQIVQSAAITPASTSSS